MADRWSNPSGGLGVNRFRVWPAGTDSYDHAENAANWDMLDEILGIPSSGTWPPTTGIDGGIYAEVKRAGDSAMPVGAMFPWFRPSIAVPIPTGFEVCDGSVIAAVDHDFDGIATSVTLPDMRNRFVLGADATKTVGEAGVATTSGNIDAAAGAPGPQGLGSSNKHQLVTSEIPAHQHTGAGAETGWSPVVFGWYNSNPAPFGDNPPLQPVGATGIQRWGNGGNGSSGAGGWVNMQFKLSTGSGSAAGGDTAHENRPRYIGLIWLIKVKNAE